MKELLKQSGIYQIRNTVNGKIYIGSSKHLQKRWSQHRTALRAGTHRSKHMQRSWNKQGELTFVFEPLITCAPTMLIHYEQQFMDLWGPEYNNRKLADSNKGNKHTAETKKIIGAAAKKMWENPAQIERMRLINTGAKRSNETKQKIRERKIESYKNPEYKEKLSRSAKERTDLFTYSYNGETLTIDAWATKTGISGWAIRQRIKAGWSIEKILTRPNQKKLLECDGALKSLADWSRECGINPATLAQRMKKGWPLKKAMTEPLRVW